MKFEFNRRYTTIAIYTLLVIIASAFAVVCFINYKTVLDFIGRMAGLLTPFVWGFAIAYILNPVLKTSEKLLLFVTKGKIAPRVNRSISVLLTFLFAIFVLFIFFSIVIPQIALSVSSLAALVPDWLRQLQGTIDKLVAEYNLTDWSSGNGMSSIGQATVEKLFGALEQVIKDISTALTTAIPQVLQATLTFTSGVVKAILGLIISIYLMFGKEQFFARNKKLLFAIFPKEKVEKAIEITHQSNDIFSGFIGGKILDSFIIGVLCFIFMSLFQWPFAMLISVIVGVTNVIPYFGPFIGAIPSILILLIVDPMTALWFALFVLVLQQVDGNIIGPKILGDSTGLSAFWVIFAITVFGSLLGFVGMFIGVPLFAVIYSLVRQFAEWKLQKKEMPIETAAYASTDHPLLLKEPKPPKKIRFSGMKKNQK